VHAQENIRINQLGYHNSAPKIAVVTRKTNSPVFYIVAHPSGDTVFSGSLSNEKQSAYSSIVTRMADFSNFKKRGTYKIVVASLGSSYAFDIGERVYDEVSKAVLKGFYFQRSDMPLEERFAGKWKRGAGHLDTAVLVHPSAADASRPAGTVVSSPRGWYDAGDYNKYIVNSGITMGTILSAYEDFPIYFDSLNTNIPESNNAIPDVLDELLYNLRWMLTMQDPNDGGVYHKCTNASFDGMVNPGVTQLPRYVVQKSTAATLDFAAVMAQAARVFNRFDKQLVGLSDSCRQAAIKAWTWSVQHPSLLYDQRRINKELKPAVTTGEYGDRNLNDEWLWAAAELYVTTKDIKYQSVVVEKIKSPIQLPSWGNVAMLGCYTLLRHDDNLPSSFDSIISSCRKTVVGMADQYLSKWRDNAFYSVMGQSARDFIWGSNAVAANQAILLINSYLLSKNRVYLDGALSNLDYILGRNATGYSFITGVGKKPPMHPHHRPSEADGISDPVPGLLVGGPNAGMQDKCRYPSSSAEAAYTDDVCSYASNEIAINWNAPAVYMVNALRNLYDELAE
jgi:endoglucanase